MGREGGGVLERERTPMRFSVGDEVEVSWDDEGFGGAWYEAKVVRAMARTRRYTVVHDHILADDDAGGEPRFLREIATSSHVRPRSPRHGGPFATHQPVEAWHNDGWWTGLVEAAVDEGKRYTVCFPNSWERIEFAVDDLRAHLEWVGGMWVRPDENTPGPVALAFPVGMRVEVVHRTRNSLSMWFTATIEKLIWKNNLLVQYDSLRADDAGKFLREIVDARYVRPCPPLTLEGGSFSILEEVEAFHDGGWCVGFIVRNHSAGSKYSLMSEHWEGEMEFCCSDLRLQHEWTGDYWVLPSKAKYIKSGKNAQAKSVERSQGSHARHAHKTRGPIYVSVSSDCQDETTNSNTEMEDASTFEEQIGLSVVDTVADDLQFSQITAGAGKFLVQAEKEFVIATPALEERGISHIICTSKVQQPRFKKQSKWKIAKHLNTDGKNDILVTDKAEHRSRGQSYPSYINHETKDVHHRIKWAHKCARSPRMNSPPQKKKVMGQQTRRKRRCIGRSPEAKAQNTESLPEGKLLGYDPLDICQDNIQLADKEVGEASQGSPFLLQLDPVLEADPSREELVAQRYDLIVSPDSMMNETSKLDGVQLNEAVREKQAEALCVPLGGCESHVIVTEETGVTTDPNPCGSPLKFNLPFVKSSSMWVAIEGTEVFHSIPQQPHFLPLLKYWEEFREGMALGLMVTFNNLVTDINKLQITAPKAIFMEKLKMFSHLESHGFDVQRVRDRLEKLLRIKYNHGQHVDKRTALQGLILEQQKEQQKLMDEIEMLDKSVNELDKAMEKFRDMRSTIVVQKETNDYEITKLQTDEKAETQSSLSAEQEFDSTLAAAW